MIDLIPLFVAVPLGSGRSVESQLTGADEMGGLQVMTVSDTEETLQGWRPTWQWN